jgi:ubiquinone/menaquinone biosynthesis C-methylase UbiE
MEVTPWAANWNKYYELAEPIAENQFYGIILPAIGEDIFRSFDFNSTLDFACGHGRMANIFAQWSRKLTCSDIQEESIAYCQKRFLSYPADCTFEFVVNSLEGIPLEDESVTFIYSWDSMVHFNIEILDRYISEFERILMPGGSGFIHHSNYCGVYGPSDTIWNDNPHCRASVSAEDVKKVFLQNRLSVVKQVNITWETKEDLDCITVFLKETF